MTLGVLSRYWRQVCLSAFVVTCSPLAVPAVGASPSARPHQGPTTQHSVTRQWNEALLQSIRSDYARPTVHARNLYHVSLAMWDAWATYDPVAQPVLFQEDHPSTSPNVYRWRSEAISHASYGILKQRFRNSPGAAVMLPRYDSLMDALGYDRTNTSIAGNTPAEVGNRIARAVLDFGDTDNSNEANDYANQFYTPVNPPLLPELPGNPTLVDPDRWQELSLEFFVDQAGNPVPFGYPEFLSPEWGVVSNWSLSNYDCTIRERDGFTYSLFKDPGAPPKISDSSGGYKSGFEMVSVWSAHLDPSDGVMMDASPASIGNAPLATPAQLPSFYDYYNGGDWGSGYGANPVTGQPYPAQLVPRGDYARVLAEFWADGPDSETPPGHWFVILNDVSDHPSFEKRIGGVGPILGDLEWYAKSYLAMAGAMHDSAISAWGVKGWYDYLRPISALRYMADLGQCTDQQLPSYDPQGINLQPGYIELVTTATTAPGQRHEHLAGSEDKIAVLAWRGPNYITNPEVDVAGVGWILAENWWPYQRPTFVTPPFAGYVSGHSTYSRAAAVVMHQLTGSPYFPEGLGEYLCKKNEFLVFEEGPSTDVRLQWASYYDASDQCSLSRIWGGIHPPADDLPGRQMGQEIGDEAYSLAEQYWTGSACDANGKIEIYGIGCQGEGGFRPMLSVDGCPSPGSPLQVRIKNASTSGSGYLLIARGQANSEQIGNCTLLVPHGARVLPISLTVTPGEPGSGELQWTLPPSASRAPGTQLLFQALIFDAAHPLGFTLSNGVSVTFE